MFISPAHAVDGRRSSMAHATAELLLSNQTENLIVRDQHLKVRFNLSPLALL